MRLQHTLAKSIREIDETQWDVCAGDSPVVCHAFFRALEDAGCLGLARGVVMRYVVLREPGGRILACAPTMLKWGNKREFGPEIKWLKAGMEQGCFAWPKFQAGSPFYPMMGPKLLTHPDGDGLALRAALIKLLFQLGLREDRRSAFNLMHISQEMASECEKMGALISHELRSSWHDKGFEDFADYLAKLPHRKRRMLLKERKAVASLKLENHCYTGDQISLALMDDYYQGLIQVCARYGGKPWLPKQMFVELCKQMPQSVRMFAAFSNGRFVAGVFCLQDSSTLYTDTWSAMEVIPELCFDYVCYRPIEYALNHGLKTIDAGPVGNHKTIRGYEVESIYHAHWFYNDDLKKIALQVL